MPINTNLGKTETITARASVYWIHHIDHTDFLNEGYIGVSRNYKNRFKDHKKGSLTLNLTNTLNYAFRKYKDKIIISELFSAEEQLCYFYERFLRPKARIGWNINLGGLHPPDVTGIRRTEETLKKMRVPKKDKTMYQGINSSRYGKPGASKGKKWYYNLELGEEKYFIENTQPEKWLSGRLPKADHHWFKPEHKIRVSIETSKRNKGCVAVFDEFGTFLRISREEYFNQKIGNDSRLWKYVTIVDHDANRRKELINAY